MTKTQWFLVVFFVLVGARLLILALIVVTDVLAHHT
jgi:hypothetical protein